MTFKGFGYGFAYSRPSCWSLGAAGGRRRWPAAGDHSFQILLMCYAPGGVVEMGLIALSLGVSPIMVTLHHVVRIGFTVIAIPLIGRRFLADQNAGQPR